MNRADVPSAPRVTAGEAAAFVAVIAVFFLLRLPILTGEGLLLGWNSDAAIFGLMAKAIAAEGELPVFFWGQSYMGPLTAYLAAAVGLAMGHVGPLALRLAVAIEMIAGIAAFWFALRRGFGAGAALLVALWLAIGPAFLFQFVAAPIGAEQVFVLGALLFAFAVVTELRRVRDWFVFGLLAGFGWWINQGVVFVIAASVIVAIAGADVFSKVRGAIRFRDRLLLRPEALGWRALDRPSLLLLRAIHAVLLLFFVLGLLRAAQFRVPAFFLFEPVLETAGAIVVYHLVVELLFGSRMRASLARTWEMRRSWFPRALAALCGAAIGYAPVIIGALTGAYPQRYGFSVPLATVTAIPRRVIDTVRSDIWRLVGADGWGWGTVVGVAMVVLLVLSVERRRPRRRNGRESAGEAAGAPLRTRAIALLTILLCATFYIFSTRAHLGAMRYVVLALPMIYAFAGEELLRWRRGVALPVAIAITLALAVPRIQQARDVAAARSEAYATFPGAFDPRPALQTIESQGYRICYADYWIAYKLEWVSDERVRFIPYRAYDRRRDLSRRLAAATEPKCFVAPDGSVRPFRESGRSAASSAIR